MVIETAEPLREEWAAGHTACVLLLKRKETAAKSGGQFFLSAKGTPLFRGWVLLQLQEDGSFVPDGVEVRREGWFRCTGRGWKGWKPFVPGTPFAGSVCFTCGLVLAGPDASEREAKHIEEKGHYFNPFSHCGHRHPGGDDDPEFCGFTCCPDDE